MRKIIFRLACCLICLCFVSMLILPSFAQKKSKRRQGGRHASTRGGAASDNGCNKAFAGSDRKQVKLRPANLDYTAHNGGRPISVAEWFQFVCPLDAQVPTRKADIPATKPMDVEKVKVTVKAFVLAMKQENDNDFHIQIADRASPFKQEQLVIEIPPGAEFCDARTKMMDLFRADGGTSLTRYVFKHPPLVEVTGYLFLDSAHMTGARTDYCTMNGGRGIKGTLPTSPVRGIWEIHPVISLQASR